MKSFLRVSSLVFISSMSLMASAAPLIEIPSSFNVAARAMIEDEIAARDLYDDIYSYDARSFSDDSGFQELAARAPFTDEEIQELITRSSMSTGSDVVGKIEKGLSAASIATSAVGGPVALAVNVAKYAALALEKIFSAIDHAQQADANKRGDFTKGVVSETLKVHPGWNVVIVHTQHKTKFDGKQGTDYAHEHKELSMSFPVGSTIGFEIYTFRSGEFTLEGDGGFMNWAYGGQFTKDPKNEHHLFFKKSAVAQGTATQAEVGFKGEKPDAKKEAPKAAPKKAAPAKGPVRNTGKPRNGGRR